MSIILSIHPWDGITRMNGTYIHSITLGYITLTLTTRTIETIIKMYRD